MADLYPDLDAAALGDVVAGAFPSRVLEETREDLDTLAQIMTGLGVTVHRPDPVAHDAEFATPHWRTSGFYSYCPRDLALVVGEVIIQAPSPMRARQFELAGLRALFQDRMLGGSPWIAAPSPQLREDMFPPRCVRQTHARRDRTGLRRRERTACRTRGVLPGLRVG